MTEHPYQRANLRPVRESISSRLAIVRSELTINGALSLDRRRLLEARARDLKLELEEIDRTPEGLELRAERRELSAEVRRALAAFAKKLVR